MMHRFIGLLFALFPSISAFADPVEQWREMELSFTSESSYQNPYTDVEGQVEFIGPKDIRIVRPMFWDGDKTFCVRFSSPLAEGEWTWRSSASPQDGGLHAKSGSIKTAKYTGDNPLLQRGLLRMSEGKRTVVYADGSPFLMIGDTAWALPWRATAEDTLTYAKSRQAHGFNTVLLMTLLPDRDAQGPEVRTESQGFAVAFRDLPSGHINEPNIEYFQYFDGLRDTLIDHGLVPVYQPVFHGFGWKGQNILGKNMSPDEYTRYCRYLVARYGAKPAMWLVGADSHGRDPGVKEGGEAVEKWDAYKQPTGIHYSPKADNKAYQDAAWLDFQWCQTGHGGKHRIDRISEMYTNQPIKAVANGEPTYEAISQPDRAVGWWQGHSAWIQYTAGGTMGIVYGAGGLWQWKNTPDESGWPDWCNSNASWRDALVYEGAAHAARLGAILKGLNVTDIERRHELANGNLCLAKEGELYIVYMPEEGELKLSGLKKDLRYRWYNPKSGKLKEEATIKDIEMDFRAPLYPAVLIVDRQ